MDKFGIFNLINSFITYYKNSKPVENNDTKVKPDKIDDKPPTKSTATRSALKYNLYSAMSSHDDFVKRVLKNKNNH